MKKKNYMPRATLDKTEVDYISKLSKEEREFLEKFDYDYYAGGVYKDDSVLETDEQKKEARFNHNSLSRDAFTVAKTTGALADLDEADKEFMEEACDEWDYERVYMQQGLSAAIHLVMSQCIRDMNNPLIEKRTTLSRFFVKMLKIKRINRNAKKGKSEKA